MGKFTLVTQKKKGSYLVQKVISVGKRKKATRRKQHQYMLHVGSLQETRTEATHMEFHRFRANIRTLAIYPYYSTHLGLTQNLSFHFIATNHHFAGETVKPPSLLV
jgi:hypothetical protein